MPKEPLDFLFGVEPIEAWRIWKVRAPTAEYTDLIPILHALQKYGNNDPEWLRAPRLCAFGVDTIWWEGRRMEAECRGGSPFSDEPLPMHDSPARDCLCGIWGLKTRQAATRKATTNKTSRGPSSIVYGRVALWGRFIEYTRGYRAQYAYPLELWFRGDEEQREPLEKRADAIGKLYGIPTHVQLVQKRKSTPRLSAPAMSATAVSATSWKQQWSMPWPDSIVHPAELHRTLGIEYAKTLPMYVAQRLPPRPN